MLLLVDLDGVVYRGATPVPGVAEVLREHATAGDRVMYVTNNSRSHRDEYQARLAAMGLALEEQSIVTAARATAVLVADQRPKPRCVMYIGGPGLERELADVGLSVVGPSEGSLAAQPDVLVVGVDFELTYERLSAAAEAVRRGARFVATNRDPVYPAADRLTPGAGSLVAAIATAAGREPDIVVGKPESRLFETAAELAGSAVRDAVVIGDNLLTDIAAARAVGARSVLMLTGVTSADDLAATPQARHPTAVAADAAELAVRLEEMRSALAPNPDP